MLYVWLLHLISFVSCAMLNYSFSELNFFFHHRHYHLCSVRFLQCFFLHRCKKKTSLYSVFQSSVPYFTLVSFCHRRSCEVYALGSVWVCLRARVKATFIVHVKSRSILRRAVWNMMKDTIERGRERERGGLEAQTDRKTKRYKKKRMQHTTQTHEEI